MENIIYTIEEINTFVDILKSKLNIQTSLDNLSSEELIKNEQYVVCLQLIKHITVDNNTLLKTYIIGKLNSAINIYTRSDEKKIYTIEAINEFINILNS
jgi:hypothetical protein